MTFPRIFFLLACLGSAAFTSISGQVADPASAKPGALARQLNEAYIGVFERVSPAVVVIEIEKKADADSDLRNPLNLFRRDRQQDDNDSEERPELSEGSGIICRPDGFIYTNSHVVEGADKITVKLKDGRDFPARLIGNDSWSDVAVIKIDAKDLPVAELADSDQVRVGQIACVIGAPFNFTYSFTTGVVSAKGRSKVVDQVWSGQFEDFIQTDASINPGNSGGPLLDLDGRVIGMNTLIQGFNRGLGFAISSNMLRQMGEQIISAGKISRPWLGLGIVSLKDLPPTQKNFGTLEKGVLVRSITNDTPAFRSELRPADVILQVDDVAVAESSDLQREVQKKKVGQTLNLKIWRGGKELTIPVTTAELPSNLAAVNAPAPRDESTEPDPNPIPKIEKEAPLAENATTGSIGLKIQTLTEELADAQQSKARGGVIVTEVAPGSAAELAGLKTGDIIMEMNGRPVSTADGMLETLQEKDLQRGVLLFVERGSASSYMVLKDLR